jgi:hypothetical protein
MTYPSQAVENLILRTRTGCDESLSSKVVEFMNSVRTAAADGQLYAAFSIRNSQNFVNAILSGAGVKLAFRATILDRLSEKDMKKVRDMGARFWPEILR